MKALSETVGSASETLVGQLPVEVESSAVSEQNGALVPVEAQVAQRQPIQAEEEQAVAVAEHVRKVRCARATCLLALSPPIRLQEGP